MQLPVSQAILYLDNATNCQKIKDQDQDIFKLLVGINCKVIPPRSSHFDEKQLCVLHRVKDYVRFRHNSNPGGIMH